MQLVEIIQIAIFATHQVQDFAAGIAFGTVRGHREGGMDAEWGNQDIFIGMVELFFFKHFPAEGLVHLGYLGHTIHRNRFWIWRINDDFAGGGKTSNKE